MSQRQIVFDTETTGLDPQAGHRIVEIGCVEVINYVRTGKVFHTYLNPERDMPAEAQKIHGLSEDFLKDKPLFSQKAQEFLEFIANSVLVAHNASFDMRFINHELKQLGKPPVPPEQVIDTLELTRRKYPGQPASLDALCRRFNIDLSERTKHGALLDAELLADVYLELMGGRQASFGLNQQAEATGNEKSKDVVPHQPAQFAIRQFSASLEELERHQQFIERYLKQPIWAEYS